DRPDLVPETAESSQRRRSRRARGHHRIQAGTRHRYIQLRRSRRIGRGRSRNRRCRNSRLCDRRRRGQAGQSDDRGRSNLRWFCTRNRDRALRRDAVRSLGTTAGLDIRRLPSAGPHGGAVAAARPYGDARSVHGVRRQGHRRGRRNRPAGGHRQRRERCLAADECGAAPFPDHPTTYLDGYCTGGPEHDVKPVRFDYERPSDIATALALGAREDIVVKFLAGGQSLGPMLNLRLVQPDLLVDITGIAQLKRVDQTPEAITIGSCVTHADIEDGRVPDVAGGALRTVAAGIAYRAVRNRGTIGGSLAHADPSADWISALSALGATLKLRSAAGTRNVAMK